jgi:hypothetical protein
MGFPAQTPVSFSRPGIESLKEGQIGCYGLYRPNNWVYIGRGDIRARLLAHLNGDNPCITRQAPTYFVIEITRAAEERERQLIRQLRPRCNGRLG